MVAGVDTRRGVDEMSVRTVTVFACDFCGAEVQTVSDGIKSWFEIETPEAKGHACHECGVSLRYVLSRTDSPVDFFKCTQYDDSDDGFGYIKMSSRYTVYNDGNGRRWIVLPIPGIAAGAARAIRMDNTK